MNADRARKTIILLLVLLFVIYLTGHSVAEPINPSTGQNEGKAISKPVTSEPPSRDSTVTDFSVASKESTVNAGALTKDSKKDGAAQKLTSSSKEASEKLQLDDYEDPGKPKEKRNTFVQFLFSVLDVIKYLFYLIVVLVIGFLAIYGVKIFTTKYNTFAGGGQELINILDIRYLAPGKAICLVEIAGKVLALGLSGNNINLLSEFVNPEQVDALKQVALQKPQPLKPFQVYLRRFTKRFSSTSSYSSENYVNTHTRADENSLHWKDSLRATGENISKLLEDIKNQDSKRSRPKPDSSDRGEQNR